MSAVPLRRRIPPKTAEQLAAELMEVNADMSAYDAQILGKQMYDHAMEEIYRLAHIGEAFNQLQEYGKADLAQIVDKNTTEHWMQYWTGIQDGWNGARQWVIDNTEDES